MTELPEPTYPPERTATESIAYWNREFNVDFKKLFGSLVKLATGATFHRWDQVAVAAADAVQGFRADLPPEGLFWLLVRRSLDAATHGLIVESPVNHVITGCPEADEIAEKLDRAFREQRAEIPRGFLERPADLDLLTQFQGVFRRWLVATGVMPHDARSLAKLLPTAFIYEVRREWDRRFAEYARLKSYLEGPLAKAEGVERAWLAHPARLEREAREPVFLESFGLRDIYVRPRAFYVEELPMSKQAARFESPKRQRVVVDLHARLGEWAERLERQHALQVVSGDPGSGKSSFSRIFAADQAALGRRVLRIPLHEYRTEAATLDKGLAEFAPWSDPTLGSPLEPSGGGRDLLLIFDGLDELAQADQTGAELALGFVRQVREWVRDAWAQGRKVQVLLTGRTPVVQSVSEQLKDACSPLELLPLGPPWPEGPPLKDPGELLTDLRPEWWKRYARLVEAAEPAMPEPLIGGSLAAFTQQPLLCILVARWWRNPERKWNTEQVNRNEVLVSLLKDVYDGAHNRRKHPSVRDLAFPDYVQILEEVALVVWHHGGRLAPVERIRDHLERTPEIARLLKGDVADALDAGLFRLLAAFYFRRGESARREAGSLEFTHKQFSEYLVACRMVRAVDDLHEGLHQPRRPLAEADALTLWTRWFGAFTVSPEILQFLRDELDLRQEGNHAPVERWVETLSRLLSCSMWDGIPTAAFGGCETHRQVFDQCHAAETALLAAADGCLRAIHPDPGQPAQWCLPLTAREAEASYVPRRWLFALLEGEGRKTAVRCLRHLPLSRTHLDEANLYEADLFRATLSNARLYGARLYGADLDGANLYRATLCRATLSGANLYGANLYGANLYGANLSEATLSGANLSEATLDGATLSGANLSGANLSEATLDGANLSGANLSGAALDGAILDGANLSGANLSGATLDGANLSGANLSGANLSGANLRQITYGKYTHWPENFDPE
jgi:uncharacterized protein YjbI with pentapeptide repeats